MARILKKIPDFKLPKFKMKEFEEIEELKTLYTAEDLDRMKEKLPGKRGHHECYPGTDYKTVKEFFMLIRDLYWRPSIRKRALKKSPTGSSAKT